MTISSAARSQPGCIIRMLPPRLQAEAARIAIECYPGNRPPVERASPHLHQQLSDPMALAAITDRMWGPKGVTLSVSFMESVDNATRDKILSHMNAWSEFCAIKFVATTSTGQVRITRSQGGYASYLGTDILSVPLKEPTMWLEGITSRTSEAECRRAIRHEAGHTGGFAHEHLRRQLVQRLDVQRTLAYFADVYGWTADMTWLNVLTPLDEASIRGTPDADQDSIMAYQLPGSITTDGQPIRGGTDIDALDRQWAASLYPKAGGTGATITLSADLRAGTYGVQ